MTFEITGIVFGMIYRVAVYHGRGTSFVIDECERLLSLSRGSIKESWIKCNNMISLLEYLEAVVNLAGPLHGLGGLDGSFVKLIPSSLDALERLASSYIIVKPGSPVEVEIRAFDSLSNLSNYVEIMTIGYPRRTARVKFKAEVDTRVLFDSKLRLLKPIRAPP